MGPLIVGFWIFFIFVATWLIVKLSLLKIMQGFIAADHGHGTVPAPIRFINRWSSLALAVIAIVIYMVQLIWLTAQENYTQVLCPFGYISLCVIFIMLGGKKLDYATQTAVWSEISEQHIDTMHSSGANWHDPFLESVSVDPHHPGLSANLQEIHIEIPKTPEMLTKDKILIWLEDVSIMLHLHGEIDQVFKVHGGAKVIHKRILEEFAEILNRMVGKRNAADLDTNKKKTLEKVAKKLHKRINEFCKEEGYPFEIPEKSHILIKDSKLEQAYYDAARKPTLARMEQSAKDIEAESIRNRVIDTGKKLLPDGSAADQVHEAKIILGITPEKFDHRSFGIDPETRAALGTALVEIGKFMSSKAKKTA